MESIMKLNHHSQNPLNLSSFSSLKQQHRSLFLKPLSFFTFTNKSPLPKALKSTTCLIKASSSLPKPQFQTPQSKTLYLITTFLKTTCIALTTTALFFNRFAKPSLAAPISPPTLESSTTNTETDEEKVRFFEEYLQSNPDDVRALKALMEVKVKSRKLEEAISIIDRLIEIEPLEKEWVLLKSHFYTSNGDIESAKLGFEEILSKDPFVVEAYHGLVMAMAQSESGELDDVMKRIENVMEKCEKEKNTEPLRDFKLLVAQVRVIEGKYMDALKVYQELVKEEPRDFRPYLCQGIIYTLLKKKDEAEKQFEKYRRLVPKEHPYARAKSFSIDVIISSRGVKLGLYTYFIGNLGFYRNLNDWELNFIASLLDKLTSFHHCPGKEGEDDRIVWIDCAKGLSTTKDTGSARGLSTNKVGGPLRHNSFTDPEPEYRGYPETNGRGIDPRRFKPFVDDENDSFKTIRTDVPPSKEPSIPQLNVHLSNELVLTNVPQSNEPFQTIPTNVPLSNKYFIPQSSIHLLNEPVLTNVPPLNQPTLTNVLLSIEPELIIRQSETSAEFRFEPQPEQVNDLLDFWFKFAAYTEDPYDFSKEFNIGDLYRDKIELKIT
ncbi:hypothetical protein GIB67_014238 [Kingdonia uniflora]|uniref:Uncharacterized protein n=1 Tax=Kingdonia uniflora TaxID=39325 RepID=A0A7J7M1Y8_9MAGN|nr:hypothetical protein GIB67_014238 [Kingdonia uniflora]